ncbi:MAG: HAD family hydrolase [Candidatus Ornithospirochaeta sp.]|nr:HAD family hydrolase [Sphaerochaetaceae bacterium]MDY5523305.1 HAD family hydrolase [Candidatus Ornithospirochaeta sp.]
MERLIFCDVDGTLTITEKENWGLLRQVKETLKKKEIVLGLATGRSLDQTQKLIEFLEPQGPVITNNGSSIFLGNQCLFSVTLDISCVFSFVDALYYEGVFQIFGGNRESIIYTKNMNPGILVPDTSKRVSTHLSEDELIEAKIQKVYINECGRKSGIIHRISEKTLPDRSSLSVLDYGSEWEITSKGTSKGNALRWLQEHGFINLKDVSAIGDSLNDIEMLEMVGTGIAVGNASSVVKDSAAYKCSKCCTYGVLEALQQYF